MNKYYQKWMDFIKPFEDWAVNPIGLIANETQGYTKLVYSGGYDDAIDYKMGLEAEGIACRIEAVGLSRGCVYVKEG